MRILIVLGQPNPIANAAWARISLLSYSWSKKGHTIAVLGAFSYNSLSKRGSKVTSGKTIYNIVPTADGVVSFAFMLNTLTSFLGTTIFSIAKRPTIAVVSIPNPPVGLGAMMAFRLLGIDYIVEYRDEWEEYSKSLKKSQFEQRFYTLIKKVMPAVYNNSLSTITVTDEFSSQLSSRGVKRIKIMPNGADISVFYPRDKIASRNGLNIDGTSFIMVYCGFIGGYYKLQPWLKAVAKCNNASSLKFKLIIIGEGPDVPELKILVKQLHLDNSIIFLGVIASQDKLAEVLSCSDVGIIPGVYAKGQLAVKFFEYCACSLPVIAIAPDDSVIATLIRKYDLGVTYPSMNDEKMQNVITKFAIEDNFRKDAGARARKLIIEQFDRNKIAQDYLAYLENL